MAEYKKSKSLLVRTILLVVIFLVLPIVVAGSVLYSQINSALTQMEKERATVASEAVGHLLDKFSNELLGVLQSNSHWEDNRIATVNRDVVWIQESVDVSVDIIPNLHFISTVDLKGNVISQRGDVKEFTGKLAEMKILEQLQQQEVVSGLMETSQGLAVVVATYITDEAGEADPAGVLIFGRILDDAALQEIKESLKDDIALLTTNGTFLKTTTLATKEKLTPYLNKENVSVFQVDYSNDVENAQMMTTLKDFTGKPVGVLFINEEQSTSSVVKGQLKLVYIVIAALFASIIALLAYIMFKLVIRPIQQLVGVSKAISEGNLQVEVPDSLRNRSDEFGQLGNAMATMIHNFHQLIEQVTNMIKHIAISSEELSISANATTNATNQIASEIADVASGAENQVQGANTTSTALQKMSAGLEHIIDSVSLVSKDSAKTEQAVKVGNEYMQQMINQMKKISTEFKSSTEVVVGLSEHSKEIGQIVALITNIADQTNLLALNAAIEAARAGEHGKGFAVVAEEVRTLAEQTASSTKQVADLIHLIQRQTTVSVQSMDKVNEEVQAGIHQIQQVDEVLTSIHIATTDVSERVTDVLMISQEMAASSEQVSTALETVTLIANDSSDSAQTIVASSEEQLASMEEITAAAEELANIAQQLKVLISKFSI